MTANLEEVPADKVAKTVYVRAEGIMWFSGAALKLGDGLVGTPEWHCERAPTIQAAEARGRR